MGRYSGYGYRYELDGLIFLDTKDLKRFHMLATDTTRSLTWTNSWGDKSRIMIAVNPDDRRARVWYTVTDSYQVKIQRDYYIPLDSSPCNYGGQRWWFLCPNCYRRVRKLYMMRSYFTCRACHNLCYTSQNENHRSVMYRLFEKHDKAEKLLESIKTPYYNGKPTRKMKRYIRLRQQSPSDADFVSMLETMLNGEVK